MSIDRFVSCLAFICTVDYPQWFLVSGSGDSTVSINKLTVIMLFMFFFVLRYKCMVTIYVHCLCRFVCGILHQDLSLILVKLELRYLTCKIFLEVVDESCLPLMFLKFFLLIRRACETIIFNSLTVHIHRILNIS